MSPAAILPALNAVLNGLSASLLVCGYVCVRRRKFALHKRCMLSAFGSSALFLVGYLSLHAVAGMTRFQGRGWIRPVYFAVLTSHTILAAAIVPLAILTAVRALRGDFGRHRRIARRTLPLWLYVSLTGVLIYWLLYHLYPAR